MALTARDLMETDVICVSPEAPLTTVQRLFFEEEIHGAPVVDDQGRVVGLISSADLLRSAADEFATEAPEIEIQDLLEFSLSRWGSHEIFSKPFSELTARDAMTETVVSVTPDSPIFEIARTLRRDRIHRVLVIEADQLRGVISTFDLVAVLEKQA